MNTTESPFGEQTEPALVTRNIPACTCTVLVGERLVIQRHMCPVHGNEPLPPAPSLLPDPDIEVPSMDPKPLRRRRRDSDRKWREGSTLGPGS